MFYYGKRCNGDPHRNEYGEEEHDTDRRDVDVPFAHPAVAYDGRRKEDHENTRGQQTHLIEEGTGQPR